MSRTKTVCFCMVVVFAFGQDTCAGVTYTGGSKSPDKGGYAVRNGESGTSSKLPKESSHSPGVNLLETARKFVQGKRNLNSDFEKDIEENQDKKFVTDVRRSMKQYGTEPITHEYTKKQETSYGVGGQPIQKNAKYDSMYMGGRLSLQEQNASKNLEALNAFKDMFMDSGAKNQNMTQDFAIGRDGVVLEGSEYVSNVDLNDGLHYDYRYDKMMDISAFCKTQRPWLIGNHDWRTGDKSERVNPWPTNRDIKNLIKNSIICRRLYEREGFSAGVADIPLFIDSWDGTSMGHIVIKVTVHVDDATIDVMQINNKGGEKTYKKPSVIRIGGRDADFFDSDLASKLIPAMKNQVLKELQADRVFAGLFGGELNAPIGSGLTVDESKNDVEKERKEDNLSIGVRGWCHCWNKTARWRETSRKIVGYGNEAKSAELFKLFDVDQVCDGSYVYPICIQCGRCFTTAEVGEKFDISGDEIFDVGIYNRWHDKAGSEIPRYKYKAMLGEARDRLLVIPDGQIVIPGRCSCKYPDPIKVGLKSDDPFFVCCFCGRIRIPDKMGSMPTGPTAWRAIMGPDKPFPGYKKESKRQY